MRDPGSVWLPAVLLTVSSALAVLGLLTVASAWSGSDSEPLTVPGEDSEAMAPRHVLATQGPTDPAHLRVLVTWDRSDPSAEAYDVWRDGRPVGSIRVSGDAWDDLAYEDRTVTASTTYRYEVRARFADGRVSPPSPPADVLVRSDGDLGAGTTFAVDAFTGTDSERAQAAVDAARRAGGGVVQFGPRTYRLERTLEVVDADEVVLRGSGADRTILEPAFAGSPEACWPYAELISFRGRLAALDEVRVTAPITRGSRAVTLASPGDLAPGDVIVFDALEPQETPEAHHTRGVVQDPSTGRDDRYRWDANEVVAVDGDTVTFRHPFAHPVPADVGWQRLERGHGNGLERMTVQGPRDDVDTYYRLVGLDHVADFGLADVRGRWANAQFVRASGYDIRVVGFDGPHGGASSFDAGNCKYKFSVYQAANFTFVDGTMGEPIHDDNQDFIVFQWAQRALVRHSRFWGSRTMAINEHGGGSRGHLYENNFFATGPRSTAAVWLGNSTWGFGGPVIIRNNTFESNARDLYVYENTFGVQFLDNVSRGTVQQGVYFEGWAGPDTDEDLYGSARMVIARNEWHDAQGDGLVLGADTSAFYPYAGIRDVIVADNHLGFPSRALVLLGDARQYQVSGNTGGDDYRAPELGEGVYWWNNADGRRHGEPAAEDWDTPVLGWEPGASR